MFDRIAKSRWFQFWATGKRYHLLFWVAYMTPWQFLNSDTPFAFDSFLINFTYTIALVGAAYFNIYFLIPKLIKRQKYVSYVLALTISIFLFAGLLAAMLYGVAYFRGLNFGPSFFKWPTILGPTLGSVVSSVFLVMAIKLLKERIEQEKHNRKLEKEKMETELKFLRSQLNPHFLFNALNNIYFMIKKDPDQAAEALAKFSDVLRYQLYGSNEETISLQQEVDFINNYIRIAELRKGDSFEIKTFIQENWNGEQIAPLILIPFVENAFKHVSADSETKNHIFLKLEKGTEELNFYIENTIPIAKEKAASSLEVGGIGLTNVKRRLALLYPNQHELEISEKEQLFKVELKLKLT